MRSPLLPLLLVAPFLHAAPSAPDGLQCELMTGAQRTVITDATPEFGWIVRDSARGAVQSAWQIVVASSSTSAAQGQGDVWDSGKVASAASVNVSYAGPALRDNQTCFWAVRTWDAAGNASPWSTVAEFKTGKLQPVGPISGDPRRNDDFSDRLPGEWTEVPAVALQKSAEGDVFADFGKAAFGAVRLSLDAPAAGTLTVRLGEVLEKPGRISRTPGGTRRYREMTVPFQAGRSTVDVVIPADKRNSSGDAARLPPGVPEVMPFRYAEIAGAPGTLTPEAVVMRFLHTPWADQAAAFDSSDKTLNQVWDICVHSIKVTSFLGVYIDGDRERIPYEGDAYINQLCHYGMDREYALARYSIRYLMARPTWPAEWQMHMPMMVWQDYLYTGNTELIEVYRKDLEAKTLQGLARADGLIVEDKAKMTPELIKSLKLTQPPRILVDWPASSKARAAGERDGYDMKPVNAVANAFHYNNLRELAAMDRALGRKDSAAAWDAKADKVRAAYAQVFWNADKGIFRDAEGSAHSAQHANLFPLAFGLVPETSRKSVSAFIKSRGMGCSVYAAQHLLDGLYLAGEGQTALDYLTATHDRSWFNMIKAGSTVTMEAWDNKYKDNQDWNHAWGAAPGNLIPRQLLGVQPLEPGFARFRVKPQLGNLSFATGKVPTIRGEVKLSATQKMPGRLKLSLTVPANSVAEVHLAASGPASVTEGSGPAAKATGVTYLRQEDGCAVFAVGGGDYEFSTGQ